MRQMFGVQQHQRPRPVQRLADARRLAQVKGAHAADHIHHLGGQHLAGLGYLQPDNVEFPLLVRVVNAQMETAPLQRVAQVAGVVAGDDHGRRRLGLDRADLGHGDLEVAQHLKQERLELLFGAVDLVDQQDDRLGRADRLQDRTADDEMLREEHVLVLVQPRDGIAQVVDVGEHPADLVAQDLGVEQLLAVLPLVQRAGLVQPAVALQADQRPAQRLRRDLGQLGLADAGRSLDQDRLLQPVRQERHSRNLAVADILLRRQQFDRPVDGLEHVSPLARSRFDAEPAPVASGSNQEAELSSTSPSVHAGQAAPWHHR